MTLLPPIVLTDRDVADALLKRRQAVTRIRHVLSIGSENSQPPSRLNDFPSHKLRLVFDDIESEGNPWTGYVGPSLADAERIVAFGRDIDHGNTLVHCAAGISRSAASLLILLADKVGPGREADAVKLLLEVRKRTADAGLRDPDEIVRPNRRLVWLGDTVLGRGGALLEACIKGFEPLYGRNHWSP